VAIVAALLPGLAHGAVNDGGHSPDGGVTSIDGAAELTVLAPGRGALPDGGPFSDALYSECPPNDPLKLARQLVDGSWVLPPSRAARQVCLLVTCEERRKQLEAAPPPLGSTSLIFAAIAFGVGLFIGGYVGWSLGRWLPR
jgi:hypothetical protein